MMKQRIYKFLQSMVDDMYLKMSNVIMDSPLRLFYGNKFLKRGSFKIPDIYHILGICFRKVYGINRIALIEGATWKYSKAEHDNIVLELTLYSSIPGQIIGYGGSLIDALKTQMEKATDMIVEINLKEVDGLRIVD